MTELHLNALCAGYGDTDVISGIEMFVGDREIVTIAGTNGSGKSTLIKSVIGLTPRVTGRISYNGTDLVRMSVERRVDVGIGYVPQVDNVFADLTVMENLQLMERGRKHKIAEMLAVFPALRDRLKTVSKHLSGGERQQLAFARALMPEPKLILLDEPSAALSPALTEIVFAEVEKLPAMGVAVLMVEQRARQALAISDRGYILDAGKVVLSDTAPNLLDNAEMADLYLGGHSARK